MDVTTLPERHVTVSTRYPLQAAEIVGQKVLGSRRKADQDILGARSRDVRAQILGRSSTLEDDEVSRKAGDVRSGHRGTRDALGGRSGSDPSAQDVNTRTEDVDD